MGAKKAVRWGLLAFGLLAAASLIGCGASRSAGPDSTHPVLRKNAVKQLGASEDMSVYEELLAVLREDPDRLVRSEAAFSLGRLGQTFYSVGFFPLVDSLENDPSAFVRSAAALSLSYTRDSRSIAPLVRALKDTGRGRVAVKYGKKVTVYKACVADAARASLERIVEMDFPSDAQTSDARRVEVARMWRDWYVPRQHLLPSETAMASK